MSRKVTLHPKTVDLFDLRFYHMGQNKRGQDIWYDSVTHILDVGFAKGEFFEMWLKEVGYNAGTIAEIKAESGTVVHNTVDKMLDFVSVDYKDKLDIQSNYRRNEYTFSEWQRIVRFMDFHETYKPKIFQKEAIVYNPRHRYAGRLDLRCEIDGQMWVIDIKTGNVIVPSYFCQIAAYEKCLEQPHKLGILHLQARTRGRKKGSIQGEGWKLIEAPYSNEAHYRIFLAAKRIFDYKRRMGEIPTAPKVISLPRKIKLTKWD